MDKSGFTNLQLIAIAGAVKGKALEEAKSSIADNTAATVDPFLVRISGTVQKGAGKPGGSYDIQPVVNLATLPVFCEVLACCGIGETRLRRALEEIDPRSARPNPKFESLFAEIAAAKAAKLPVTKGMSGPTAGAVTSQIQAEKVEAPCPTSNA